MPKLIGLILAITLTGLMPAALATNETPEQLVRQSSKDVLDIIRKNDKDPAKIRDQVDARVAPLADYTRMTQLAAGRYWKTATPEQQQALTREFRTMLVRTYLSALSIYKNAQVEVRSVRQGSSSDEQDVRTEVTLPGEKPIPLDFSFEKNSNDWKVYDISVNGVSFINNHRNTFASVIKSEGIDGLIKQLASRNASGSSNK
ncbi:MlaC/ttg2D family ABC transporter substrate-binding protein [Chitinilyticum piscinae]|uniref:ABC transporter substrate-binding protein n=1 Tax=Chitinilyticum piscinae TaxID=2866724 RepID=A0A8J7FNV5_9NEIS|nr:ABC transporter substrate-binding protein [Chitinilyticum piscinae]MBE9607761.1 ABC transporter substrate-binding protein [Chitinilyticum piscinae]